MKRLSERGNFAGQKWNRTCLQAKI